MPSPPAISASLKRKKWTEEEERSLINKYAEMQSDGILAGNRTREKKFRPIAAHVNSSHHSTDPSAYPFLWSWKDASTKVQNMRHQFLLVKQKLLLSSSSNDPFDWSRGLALWPNFLLYRDVFGDSPLPPKLPDEDGGFDYDEAPPPPLPLLLPPELPRRKRKRRRRRRREWARVSLAIRERDRVDREEEEREWEEGVERRRAEWKKRMDGMVERHRAEMEGIRARVLQEQQAVVNQLIGIVSHFGGVGDVAAMGMVQVNGMTPGENRVGGGDGQDDQFIVDARLEQNDRNL